MIHNCCAFGTADLQQCPPLGSAAGAAAGAEAEAEAGAEARAEAGAVVEARTATGGSISTTYATTTVARRGLGEVTADTLSPRGKRGEVKNPPLPKPWSLLHL